eukprot:CAMPEP_0172090716 /NCGR_PEP_ID=MMETSP1043-20130122/24517_1 /TAXON_ID=464988 /ORGANISM="Hemiselmis andersenii, Strain CCMP441" /LENGTH=314 /DNA_ID=CAMNT_0012753309 /DNA_START=72 /DNA_END=1017 /DNA_ORIENTATION=+
MCVARMHSGSSASIVGEDLAHTHPAMFQAARTAMSPLDAVPGFPNLRRLREGSPIMRASCPTKCPPEERGAIRSKLGVRSLVDLRTADERHGDPLPTMLWDSVVRVRQGGKTERGGGGGGGGAVQRPAVYHEADHAMGTSQRALLGKAPADVQASRCDWIPAAQPGHPAAVQQQPLPAWAPGPQQVPPIVVRGAGEGGAGVDVDKSNLPMVFFCSLGKDRTGVISMLALHCGGASRDEIREDFKRSANGLAHVRAEVMASLEKRGLDPEEFISARAELVDDVFEYLDFKYGSADAYLDAIGFGAEWREKLREVI